MTSWNDAEPRALVEEPRPVTAVRVGRRAAGVRTTLPVQVIERRTIVEPAPAAVDVTPLVECLERSIPPLVETVRAAFRELEDEFLALTLQAARHITRTEIEAGRYDLAAPLKEILAAHGERLRDKRVVLLLHPDDLAKLAPLLEEAQGVPLRCAADPSAERGSLELRFDASSIVRSVTAELAALKRAMLREHDEP